MVKNISQKNRPKIAAVVSKSKISDQKAYLSPIARYALFLAILSFCLYVNTFDNGYVLDDLMVVQNNRYVKQGVSAIPDILSTPYLYGTYSRNDAKPPQNDLYRPMSLVLFALEYQFLPNNPVAGHFINVFLFSTCVALLFLFLHNLFYQKEVVLSFIAALLFAVHPIHTEVVANIKSCDELLCFLFSFFSLLFFVRFADTSKIRYLIISLVSYFLALLAKETAITLLVVFPVIFILFHKSNRNLCIVITLSALATAILYLAVRYYILISHHAYNPTDIGFLENALTKSPSTNSRLATELLILGQYLKLLILPYPLICDYSFSSIPFVNFSNFSVWVSLIIYIALVIVFVVRFWKKQFDPILFGIFFFITTISIFSNLFMLIGSEMAERFLFFPSVGFCIAVAYGIQQVGLKLSQPQSAVLTLNNRTVLLILVPVCIVFFYLTTSRNNEWADKFTLYSADLAKSPDDARLLYMVSVQEINRARSGELDRQAGQESFMSGIKHLQHALAVYPAYAMAHSSLANAFVMANQLDSAQIHCVRSLELKPDNDDALNTLANVYMMQNKFPLAMPYLSKAMEINSTNKNYPLNLGLCQMETMKYDSALSNFKIAYAIEPDEVKTLVELAIAFDVTKKPDSAKKYETLARRHDPKFSLEKIRIQNK